MDWSTLKATVIQCYQTNEDAIKIDTSDVITSPSYLAGVKVNEIYLEMAKNELKADIYSALDFKTDETDYLDNLVTDYEYRLQIALRNKQLELFYRAISEEEGSKTHDRWRDYQTAYETSRLEFYKMDYKNDSKKLQDITVNKLVL